MALSCMIDNLRSRQQNVKLILREPLKEFPFVWFNSHQLACAVLAEGEMQLQFALETQAAETAIREWPKSWIGEEVTASVLDTDDSPPGLKQYAGQLLLIDTLSGNKQVLEDGNCQLLQPSPDRRWLAFFKRIATLAPDPEQPYSVRQKKQLMIADMQSLTVRKIVTTIDSGSLTWSPDGASAINCWQRNRNSHT
jgi:hypothetical protein